MENQKSELKAFILAAGYGSRLGKLTKGKPKPLLPIMGRPLLYHTLDQVQEAGIKEVAINTHYKASQVKEAVSQYAKSSPLSITLLEEETLRNTGGGIAGTKAWRKGSDLLIINSDIVHGFSLSSLIKSYQKHPGELLFGVLEKPFPHKTILWCESGKLASFEEKTQQNQTAHSFFCAHIAPDKILKTLPSEGAYGIMPIYQKHLQEGGDIYCQRINDYWMDIGTPEDYLQCHLDLQNFIKKEKKLNHPLFRDLESSPTSLKECLREFEKNYPELLKKHSL